MKAETKPFYLTSEFWASVALTIANVAGAFQIPGKWQAIVQAIITAAYAVSRGLSKSGVAPTTAPTPTQSAATPTPTQSA